MLQDDVVEVDVVDVEGDVLLGLPADRLGQLLRADIVGREIFLMMTEWPESEVPKSLLRTVRDETTRLTVSTTREASMMAPSTIASGERVSIPVLTSR